MVATLDMFVRSNDNFRFLLLCLVNSANLVDDDDNTVLASLISEDDRFLAPGLVARNVLVVESAIAAFRVLVLRR